MASDLDAHAALDRLMEAGGAAVSLVVTRAKGRGVRVAPAMDARERLAASLEAARGAGASRALAWHAEGLVVGGGCVAVVGAAAPHRREAEAATARLVAGLSGVARRVDV